MVVTRKANARGDLFADWAPEEAWLAGLLWADGCLVTPHAERPITQRVVLSTTDRELAVHASRISGAPYHESPAVEPRKPNFQVRIGGRAVVERLASIGLHPRKSLTAEMPDVPHLDAFVRGYFDGNGCAGLYRNPSCSPGATPRLKSKFTGARGVLVGIQGALSHHAGIEEKRLTPAGSVWQVNYNHRDSIRLADFMYADGGPTLTRKKLIFAEGSAQPFKDHRRAS